MLGDIVRMDTPPDFGGRIIRQIHLHHEGGGSELDDARRIEEVALSRIDQHFARIPYHLIVRRPVVDGDDVAAPLDVNPWQVIEGRPLSMIPASIKGHNEHAVAIVVAGRWDREPLPRWALNRLVEAVRWVMLGAGLGVRDIYGHRELEPTLCPGYDPAVVRALVGAP